MVLSTFLRLVTSLTVCYSAGYLASLYALPLISVWYNPLNKPGFLPPNELLLPVGLIIYLLLGLSLFFIWSSEENQKDRKVCLSLFISGLILNVLWVYVFFGLRSPLMAVMVMIMLIAVVISTVYQSLRVSIAALLLLVPYLIVCLILLIANYLIYIMNPSIPLMVL